MSTSPNQPISNIDQLLTEFSPPIDSSLIYAISSDYPETIEGLKSAREILIPLSKEIQSEEDLIEETNIGLDLNEVEVVEIDKALDAWDIEQTQIDLASSKADFESDENTTLADGSEDNITSDEDPETMVSSTSANSPISLLRCMFPSLGTDVLQHALGSDSSSVDLSLAVDLLLQRDSISFETTLSENSDPIRSPSKNTSQKRKNQQAKRGFQTIHLTDVMRGDERERLHEARKKAEEDGPNSIPENKWVTLASQTDFLSDLLKIDPAQIKSGYLRHSCNLVLALEEILNKLVIERQLDTTSSSEDEFIRFTSNLENMKQLLPDREDFLLNRLLTVTSNDPDSAFDLVRFLDELFASEGTAMWNFFHRVPINQTSLEAKSTGSNLANTSGFQQVSSSNDTGKGSRRVRPQNNPATVNRLSEAVCVSKAAHYRTLRDHAFRQAGQAYQTGRSVPTRRGGALVYAEEGRKYDLKAKYWELEAGKAKVRERNVLEGAGGAGMARRIDLHGLSRIQALAVTRDFLNRWESSTEKPSLSSPLLIITGAGKHSHKSTPVLLPAITRYLTRENWSWRYQHDHIGGSRGAVYVEGVVRS
ncbi:hypothetical protein DFH28DRAFT_951576 [Melampsora americana]|nr:hypothetical protein DFH28DRAFT_951576 [Melampsora americana]